MKITLQHKDLTIELFDDPLINQSSNHSPLYDRTYQADNVKDYGPVSQHAIIIYRGNTKIISANLLAAAGATSITSDSVLIDGDNLITRCCNTVFCLTLPGLDLNWMVEANWATCFSIHQYHDSYITHGEMSVSRIDRNGNLL